MKKLSILVLLAGLIACSDPVADKYLVSVFGRGLDPELYKKRITLTKEFAKMPGISPDIIRDNLNTVYVPELLLAVAGFENGLDSDSTFRVDTYNEKYRLVTQRNGIADRMMMPDSVAVSEDEITDYYRKAGHDLRIAQIILPSLTMAKSVYAKLQAGENFDKIAEEYSIERTTALQGGKVKNAFYVGQQDIQFENAVYRLEPGQYTAPLYSGRGYHIVKLLARKKRNLPRIESMHRRIMLTVEAQKKAQQLQEAKKQLFDLYQFRLDSNSADQVLLAYEAQPKEMINTANLAGVSVNDTIARFTGGGWTVRQLAEKYNSRTGNYTFPLLTIEDVVAFFHSNFIDELVFHHAGHSGMLADPEFTGYMMDVETRYMARTTYRLLTGDSGYTALLDSLKRVYIVNYNDELITQTAFELNQMKTGF